VRVFNLRKLGQEVFELKHDAPVHSTNFDFYGQYLLTGSGAGINIFGASKHWNEPPLYTNSKVHEAGAVSKAKFSNSGRMVVSAGEEDRFMKVFHI
jgi:WD40 repeat protein